MTYPRPWRLRGRLVHEALGQPFAQARHAASRRDPALAHRAVDLDQGPRSLELGRTSQRFSSRATSAPTRVAVVSSASPRFPGEPRGYDGVVKLITVPGVFRPRSDSWLLADVVRLESLAPGARVLDLCCGSGVLAVAAARKAADVTAVDVSRRAVATTRLNARLNGVSVRARRGNLFAPVRGERFALIVSNPPYLPSADDDAPPRGAARAWEAGPDGRSLLDPICAAAQDHLRPRGTILLVHSWVCGEQATLTALSEHGLDARVVARHRGPLGPRLASRAAWLRDQGLLPADSNEEEMLVIRGERPGPRPATSDQDFQADASKAGTHLSRGRSLPGLVSQPSLPGRRKAGGCDASAATS